MSTAPHLRELCRDEPVLALCGPSGSGKTTLLEQVIPVLGERGLRVAVVKHDVHGITLDPSRKDSARLFAAGADVVVRGPGESLWRRHGQEPNGLGAVLLDLLAGHDLVLVEGHKETPLAKLWISGPDACGPPPDVEEVVEVLPRDGARPERLLGLLDRWLPEVWARRRLLGGILIGGAAKRMGQAKQLLPFQGRPLLEAVWSAMQPHVEEVVLLGAGEVPATLAQAPRLPDVAEARGPLSGMLAAVRWAPRAAWVLAACDLPLASAEAVSWLVAERRPGRWAVLPRVNNRGIEPLLAIYEPQARPLLEAVAAAGHVGPCCIADHPSVVSPQPPAALARSWHNVNTLEDLAALDPER